MTEKTIEPVTSPVLRLGVCVLLLCCAALAIRYAWIVYERSEGIRIPIENQSPDGNPTPPNQGTP